MNRIVGRGGPTSAVENQTRFESLHPADRRDAVVPHIPARSGLEHDLRVTALLVRSQLERRTGAAEIHHRIGEDEFAAEHVNLLTRLDRSAGHQRIPASEFQPIVTGKRDSVRENDLTLAFHDRMQISLRLRTVGLSYRTDRAAVGGYDDVSRPRLVRRHRNRSRYRRRAMESHPGTRPQNDAR